MRLWPVLPTALGVGATENAAEGALAELMVSCSQSSQTNRQTMQNDLGIVHAWILPEKALVFFSEIGGALRICLSFAEKE